MQIRVHREHWGDSFSYLKQMPKTWRTKNTNKNNLTSNTGRGNRRWKKERSPLGNSLCTVRDKRQAMRCLKRGQQPDQNCLCRVGEVELMQEDANHKVQGGGRKVAEEVKGTTSAGSREKGDFHNRCTSRLWPDGWEETRWRGEESKGKLKGHLEMRNRKRIK